MGDLADYGISREVLQEMYDQWCQGATKSDLERRYLDKPESHGKLFTSLVREHLGIETERTSPLTAERDQLRREVTRLTSLLHRHGIDPNDAIDESVDDDA